MNILLISDSYPPEIRSASQIMGEFAVELKKRGHCVTVLTTKPKYNVTLTEKNKTFPVVMDEEGVKVIRIETMPLHKVGIIVRGIANIMLPYSFYKAGKKYIKDKIDLVIVYSPPLHLGIAGKKLCNYFKAKLIVNIQDIFPQQAIDLGFMKNHIIVKYFEAVEQDVYKSADLLTVHSYGNLEFLLNKKHADKEKTSIVHNWVDNAPFEAVENTGKFRNKYNISADKFVILYAGIIGLPQGLDAILDAAKLLKNEKEILFLLVGDGLNKQMLVDRCIKEGIDNVSFQEFVSLSDYPQLVKECDAGLVCLSKNNKTPVVPGKLMGYMAAEIPVIALLNKESDGHKIIKDSECGFSSISGESIKDFTENIKKLKNDNILRVKLGKKGKEYLLKNFTKVMCINEYEKLFKKLNIA